MPRTEQKLPEQAGVGAPDKDDDLISASFSRDPNGEWRAEFVYRYVDVDGAAIKVGGESEFRVIEIGLAPVVPGQINSQISNASKLQNV